VVSDRVRDRLAKIAGRVPDGDADSAEPLVAAWHDLRIALDDAEDLCTCIELVDEVERWNRVFGTSETDGMVRTFIFLVGLAKDYQQRHGEQAAARMLRNLMALMGETATVETVQLVQRKETQCD
jgi:hypothetical protein